MNAERFQKVKAIFLSACERSEDDRDGFLSEACGGDTDLRTAVEQLLAHDQTPVKLLSPNRFRSHLQRIATVELELDPSPAAMPSQIGQYRIIDILGEGGMGMVYRAEQDKPRRTVALKVIAPGRLSKQTLRRFEHEASILGRLRHPGIAQIYEAGMFETGLGDQPYFAMELVQGATLLDFARDRELPMRSRLELMAKACEAVEHAHQKGVIHRDLKPGNIIVEEGPDGGQPKILDFGVARATDRDQQAATMHTAAGQIIGTVAYMSPEQAAGDAHDLDVRADVYALGVVMYQLLTGEFPYPVDGPVHHVMGNIIRLEPRRPRLVNHVIDDEVETILLASLSKEPARRYQSSGELARDLRRYLKGDPIAAKRDSAAYLVRKMVSRHRAPAAAVALLATLVAVSSVVTFSLWKTATHERDQKEYERGRVAAEAAKSNAVNAFLNRMLLSADPEQGGNRELSVRQALDDAASQLASGQFTDQPEVAAKLHLTLGKTYGGLGQYGPARQQLGEALRLREGLFGRNHPETADVLASMAQVERSDSKTEEAAKLANEALAIVRAVPDCDPAILVNVIDIAAYTAWDANHPDQARQLMQEMITQVGRLPREHQHDVANWMANLAMLTHSAQEMDSAQQMLIESIRQLEERFGLKYWVVCSQYNKLASILSMRGDHIAAQVAERSAVQSARLIFGERHPRYIAELFQYAMILQFSGEFQQQFEVLTQVLEAATAIDGPQGARVAEALRDRGHCQLLLGNAAGSERDYREALSILRSIKGEQSALGVGVMMNLCAADMAQGETGEVEDLCREVLGMSAEAVPTEAWGRGQAASLLGEILTKRGRYQEAEPLLLEGERVLKHSGQRSTFKQNAVRRLVALYGAWDEAEPDTGRSRELARWQSEYDALIRH